MARSTYNGGHATLHIVVEHTYGEGRPRVDVRLANGLPAAPFTLPSGDPDVLRELGQALIGAADQFAADDDVTEPDDEAAVAAMVLADVADDVDHRGATGAERRVLAALSGTTPRTPAELKRRMPGATPVATVRSLLGNLQAKGLARPAADLATLEAGRPTPWVSVGAGVAHSEAERQASLEAAQALLPLTTAERAVWYALRRASGRGLAQVAKHAGYGEGTTLTLLESLEAQGYARRYDHDGLGILWRSADPEAVATLKPAAALGADRSKPWQAAYAHALRDGASRADAVAAADRAEAAVHAVRDAR